MNDQWTPDLQRIAAELLGAELMPSGCWYYGPREVHPTFGEIAELMEWGGAEKIVPYLLETRGPEIAAAAVAMWCGEDRHRWRAFTQELLAINPIRPALNGVYQAVRCAVTAKPETMLLALARAAKEVRGE